jgi:predicted dehydrogenase
MKETDMAKQRNDTGRAKPASAARAPILDYEPPRPRAYNPAIGLIGCGGITQSHLRAYRKAGFRVTALCDIDAARAEQRRQQFYPRAKTFTDYRLLLREKEIEVVDIATHPRERAAIIAAAVKAGKHVLSQKPFVTDLDVGERLADLAEARGVLLAVNQNGRWAPYFSYMRAAAAKGLIGEPYAVHMGCHWDHEWVRGGPFDSVYHLVLYDFAIHWFDMIHCLMRGRTPQMASATLAYAPGQKARPPLLGQAVISFDHGQASLVFDACTRGPGLERTVVIGTRGMLRSEGDVCLASSVTLATAKGSAVARVSGKWMVDGFRGTMGELLCAVEEKRLPSNSARDSLESLAMCFAAVASADTGSAKKIGTVRKLSPGRTLQPSGV